MEQSNYFVLFMEFQFLRTVYGMNMRNMKVILLQINFLFLFFFGSMKF
jgi:hypothetical protein